MNNISQIDPKTFLENSTARFFMIVFSNQYDTYFCLPGGTIKSATREGGGEAIEKEKVERAYYDALNNVRTGALGDGRLDIIEIPRFMGLAE